jgi:hypothetical protein
MPAHDVKPTREDALDPSSPSYLASERGVVDEDRALTHDDAPGLQLRPGSVLITSPAHLADVEAKRLAWVAANPPTTTVEELEWFVVALRKKAEAIEAGNRRQLAAFRGTAEEREALEAHMEERRDVRAIEIDDVEGRIAHAKSHETT